jgi:hypothetical protein
VIAMFGVVGIELVLGFFGHAICLLRAAI